RLIKVYPVRSGALRTGPSNVRRCVHFWQRSEIRLAGLRYGVEAVTEMVAVVLGANHFEHRARLHPPVALDRVPGSREGAGVLDTDVHVERLAVVDHAEALDHV